MTKEFDIKGHIKGQNRETDLFILSVLYEAWYDGRRKTGCRLHSEPCESCVVEHCEIKQRWNRFNAALYVSWCYWEYKV